MCLNQSGVLSVICALTRAASFRSFVPKIIRKLLLVTVALNNRVVIIDSILIRRRTYAMMHGMTLVPMMERHQWTTEGSHLRLFWSMSP